MQLFGHMDMILSVKRLYDALVRVMVVLHYLIARIVMDLDISLLIP